MIFLSCCHCGDAFKVTAKPRLCGCGACGGTLTSDTLHYTYGPHILISMSEISQEATEGQLVMGEILEVHKEVQKDQKPTKKHSLERQY